MDRECPSATCSEGRRGLKLWTIRRETLIAATQHTVTPPGETPKCRESDDRGFPSQNVSGLTAKVPGASPCFSVAGSPGFGAIPTLPRAPTIPAAVGRVCASVGLSRHFAVVRSSAVIAVVFRKCCFSNGLCSSVACLQRLSALIDRIKVQFYNPAPFCRTSRTRTPAPVNFSKSPRTVRQDRTARLDLNQDGSADSSS